MLKKFLATGAVAAAGLLAAQTALADFTLTILHINDVHSRIGSINRFDSNCNAESEAENKCFGGMARVATAIKQRRDALLAEGKAVLVLDAGDQFQGSLFYTNYKGDAAAEIMNMIGFDAMAVGNHEFDNGPANLSRFIRNVDFPVLNANYVPDADAETDGLMDLVLPAITVTFSNGEKVGIIGVVAEDTGETSSPEGRFHMTEDVIPPYVAKFEEEGVNKVILLSHLGIFRDMVVAAGAEGIDAIVGGHSHTLLSNTSDRAFDKYPFMVGNVPVVQAYAYSKYMGELELVFDDEGNVTSATGDTVVLDASFVPDAEVQARIDELAAPLEEIRNQVIGSSADIINGDRGVCRVMECAMGNLVADAMLDRVAGQGVEIAIQNGGGLRASIDAGEITMGEVLTVLPFQNTLATFEISGAQVVAALENGVSQIEEVKGRFAQVAGLSYAFDTSAEVGSRVSDVMVGGAPIDMDKTYKVATNNFMRNGGDGYKMFKSAANAYDFGPGLEDVVAEYLAGRGDYQPYTDGRITVK